jgi:dTDP-4-amino-4,6-dideoxygalactose transaminase
MRPDPYMVVREFEKAVCAYTGAPYAVAVSSCTAALHLVLEWHKAQGTLPPVIEIPKRTYVGVAQSIMNAGAKVAFRDEKWSGVYCLAPLHVFDSARRFTSNLFVDVQPALGARARRFVCTSHHWNKPLGISQGGIILHNVPEANYWLQRARYDGRSARTAPGDDTFEQPGWHYIMTPEIAAAGLVRLSFLPEHVPDLPWDDYPDLALHPRFRVKPTHRGLSEYGGGPIEDADPDMA